MQKVSVTDEFVARLCGQATWPSKMRLQKAIKKSHIIGTFNINGGIEGARTLDLLRDRQTL